MAHFFFDFFTIFRQYKNIDSKIFEFEKMCQYREIWRIGLKLTPLKKKMII
jgi:hypothetical protein